MKEFKLKSDKKTRYGSLQEMKEALGIKSPQTVFDYCKKHKDVIYCKDTTRDQQFHVFYDHKRGIGV